MLLLAIAILTTTAMLACTHVCSEPLQFPASVEMQFKFAGPQGAVSVLPHRVGSVSGAANSIVKVKSGNGGSAWLVATVNGGVWRTTDAINSSSQDYQQNPRWTNVFDASPVTCTAMTTLHVASANSARVYAGCGGATSSQAGYASNIVDDSGWTGFAVSEDAGVSWTMAPSFPRGYSVQSILELPGEGGAVLVGVRTSFLNGSEGGIFRASSWNAAVWARVYDRPVFDIVFHAASSRVIASGCAVAAAQAVLASTDRGLTWAPFTGGLKFAGTKPMMPFFSCLATRDNLLFLGVLTVPAAPGWLDGGMGGGAGEVWFMDLSSSGSGAVWRRVGAQPAVANPTQPNTDCSYDCASSDSMQCACLSLDADWAAKDRLALLINPANTSQLFVAANARFMAYRVDWQTALRYSDSFCTHDDNTATCFNKSVPATAWTMMYNDGAPWPDDTADNSFVHVDCRAWGWDDDTQTALLLSDGGVYLRFRPGQPGGVWRSFSGTLATFEYLDASYDEKRNVIVGAAQDDGNHVIQSPDADAIAFGGGDGVCSAVDNDAEPAIFFATYNNMFYTTMFQSASLSANSIASNQKQIYFSQRGFPGRASANPQQQTNVFPWFTDVFVLNVKHQATMVVWSNVSSYDGQGPGLYALNVSGAVQKNATLIFPTHGANILTHLAGGVLDGADAPDLTVAVSAAHLYYYTAKDGLAMRPLPTPFVAPCAPTYNSDFCDSLIGVNFQSCSYGCQNWPSHTTPMSLAVDQVHDSRLLAVAGWTTSLVTNDVPSEHIYLSRDAGASWTDVFSQSLIDAAQVEYSWMRVRVAGMVFIGRNVLLVATARGVCRCLLSGAAAGGGCQGPWQRLGSSPLEFPLVRVTALKYYPKSDVLIVATKGRGIYQLFNASKIVVPTPTTTTVAPTSPLPSSHPATTAAPPVTAAPPATTTTTMSRRDASTTTTASPSSSSSSGNGSNGDQKQKTAIMIGGIVGGLALVGAVIAFVVLRKRAASASTASSHDLGEYRNVEPMNAQRGREEM